LASRNRRGGVVRVEQAAKVYYLLLQLAHTISQLFELSSTLNPEFRKRITTQKRLWKWVTEAIRNFPITTEWLQKKQSTVRTFRFPQKIKYCVLTEDT
jgi:hypothetical protein